MLVRAVRGSRVEVRVCGGACGSVGVGVLVGHIAACVRLPSYRELRVVGGVYVEVSDLPPSWLVFFAGFPPYSSNALGLVGL